ncbi:hydroxyacid dehydrogenase [Chelatococcus sp. GCM10030263]|uniref:hydroxyacid dehydrogenase n=1 Tax=Chelatococcus sp. GCM10030263 TaxID=3273387 RepID=UPI003618877B
MPDRPAILLDPHPRRRQMIFNPAQWARLEAMAEVITADVEGPLPASLVEEALPRVAAILGQTDMPSARIARAPHLRAIINVEGNFQPNVDAASCFARGIEILSVGPVFAHPVAEMALGLALDLARGITSTDRAMREGQERYGRSGNDDAFLLSRATIGIVGFGYLGRALRRLLEGFRPRILVHDPWLPAAAIAEEGCEAASLEEVLSTARVIFLLAGVTSENQGFIDGAALRRIQDDAVVVLASRAAIVEFPALVAEAQSGRLRIATDVFPDEPVAPDDPVRRSPMLLSPHRAGGIPAAFHDIGERVLDDLDLILRGLAPIRLQRAQPQTVALMRSKAAREYAKDEAERLAGKN